MFFDFNDLQLWWTWRPDLQRKLRRSGVTGFLHDFFSGGFQALEGSPRDFSGEGGGEWRMRSWRRHIILTLLKSRRMAARPSTAVSGASPRFDSAGPCRFPPELLEAQVLLSRPCSTHLYIIENFCKNVRLGSSNPILYILKNSRNFLLIGYAWHSWTSLSKSQNHVHCTHGELLGHTGLGQSRAHRFIH